MNGELFRWNNYVLEVSPSNDYRGPNIRIFILNKSNKHRDPIVFQRQISDMAMWKYNKNDSIGIGPPTNPSKDHMELVGYLNLWLTNNLGMLLEDFLKAVV